MHPETKPSTSVILHSSLYCVIVNKSNENKTKNKAISHTTETGTI